MAADADETTTRWEPRPGIAALLRAIALLTPIAASVAFVHFASRLVDPPRGSVPEVALWWIGLSASATAVLIVIDRLTRRVLPLAALLKLALVFPDEAPSRFRTALEAGTTEDLELRLEQARSRASSDTPVEAAERLLGFVAALSVHDRVTRGHSERVRAYSQLIAKEMRLGRDEVDRLNWAALLHDVGKLEVPAEILNKPGRPTDEEWAQIRRHPELGAHLAQPLRAWLGEWTDAIADHHERWDGKGYPRGSEGDAISLAGRIVAVADVFDVITSARSYKTSGNAITAREEIARCAGDQFDPRVVRAFLSISLGRLRLAMGPLSWLAQAPVIGRIPFTPGLATAATSAAAVLAALAGGLVGGSHVPAPFATPAQAAAAPVAARAAPAPAAATRLAVRGGGALVSTAALTQPIPVPAPFAAVTPLGLPAAVPAPVPAAPVVAVPPASDPTVDAPRIGPPDQAPPADDASPPAPAPPSATPPVVVPPVVFVNHAPSFTVGADQTVNENAAAQSVPGWATAISPGPADESSQTVSFTVTSSDPALFSAGGRPAVADDGTLTFTPALGAFGTATVSVRAVDDGGTANGGDDTSSAQIFAITIFNRPPVAHADAPTVLEDSTAGVTFNVLANDTDPEGDALSLASYDDSTIADGGLTDNGGGSFTYVPATHFSGTDTFSYVVTDGNGGTDTGAVTITVTAVPDPPAVADDAYATQEDTPLAQSAPGGVLENDDDSGGGALSVETTPVSGPAHGSLSLAADGSFTYTPTLGYTGTDSFTYRADSLATGLHSDGVVTLTVAATFSTSVLYLGTSGISSEVWNMSTATPPSTFLGFVPDYDGDLLPGLTIKSSNGADTGNAQQSQTWRYALASPLVLQGPVTLHLSSQQSGSGVAYVYLYDCTAGGASCTQIAFGSLAANPWNGLFAWGQHDISVGTVNRTLAPGHELRVRLYVGSGNQLVAMTAGLPSSLTITTP